MANGIKEHINNAATAIHEFADQAGELLNTMRAKLETLIRQAQSPRPAAQPEDLSAEMAALDTAVGDLRNVGNNLRAVVATGEVSAADAPLANPIEGVGSPETGPHGEGPAGGATMRTTKTGEQPNQTATGMTEAETGASTAKQTTAEAGGPTTGSSSTGSAAEAAGPESAAGTGQQTTQTQSEPQPEQPNTEATAPSDPATERPIL